MIEFVAGAGFGCGICAVVYWLAQRAKNAELAAIKAVTEAQASQAAFAERQDRTAAAREKRVALAQGREQVAALVVDALPAISEKMGFQLPAGWELGKEPLKTILADELRKGGVL